MDELRKQTVTVGWMNLSKIRGVWFRFHSTVEEKLRNLTIG